MASASSSSFIFGLSLSVVFLPGFALAHSGEASPSTIGWTTWTFSPGVSLGLAALCTSYVVGWRKFKSLRRNTPVFRPWQVQAFIAAISILIIALISPVDPMSDMLASVHMVQHTLLMMVAAPLLALASPGYVGAWAVPAGLLRRRSRLRFLFSGGIRASRFGRPIVIWLLYGLTLWLWHLPVLYQAALRNPYVHDLQHLAFFCSSFLFWRILLDPFQRNRIHPGVGILYLFVASLHAMILGVLMALSPSVWYSHYEASAHHFGLSALQDQQLAGYIMWMPAGITYVVVAAALLLRLIRGTELTGKFPG